MSHHGDLIDGERRRPPTSERPDPIPEQLHTLTLDLVVLADETVEEALDVVLGPFDVDYRVTNPGPAGWPSVTFTNSNPKLLSRLNMRYQNLGKHQGPRRVPTT